MRVRHPLLTGGIIAIAAAALVACGSSAPSASAPAQPSDTTVDVAYVPASLFAPLYVAMSKGYFTQRHIEVHLTTVAAGQDAIALAASNKVQAVLAGFSAGMFNGINSGLDVKVVGSMAGEPSGQAADGLVVSSQMAGTVKTPADLRGKKIGVSGGPGAAGGYLLAEALAPYHLTLKDVTPVNLPLPEQAAALKSGGVAAALMSSPFLSDAVSSGTGKLIASAQPGTSVTGVIYGGAFAKSPAAQPFFDALAQGAQDLQGAQAKATPNLEIEAKAIGQKLSVLQQQPADVFDPRLAPPVATLDSMQQVFQQAGLLNYTTPLPSSRYVDNTYSANVPKT
ncbi:ABC transporter substrate-binding protein [Pseudonocardia xinjiangensis]|uniref:ABC transporter substrate-binding protein n=1 Tax=Pseudonocardia xinjiangensis TaxID=75289 RepID=UPI003D8A6A67